MKLNLFQLLSLWSLSTLGCQVNDKAVVIPSPGYKEDTSFGVHGVLFRVLRDSATELYNKKENLKGYFDMNCLVERIQGNQRDTILEFKGYSNNRYRVQDKNGDGYLDLMVPFSELEEFLVYEFNPKENKFKEEYDWYEGIEEANQKDVIPDLVTHCEKKGGMNEFQKQDSVGICISAFAKHDDITLSVGGQILLHKEGGHDQWSCLWQNRKEIKSIVEIDINGIHFKKPLPKCDYNFIDIYLAENHVVQVFLRKEKPTASMVRQP